jgi:hypothetical protein
MTEADWLLIVLSSYFHDVGMLVTESEYAARADSDFESFCAEELFVGDKGRDYKSKVMALGDDADRFLYQEYVRYHHAGRIADWIQGQVDPRRGVAPDTADAVSAVLGPLPETFRRDLALVCESHHLSDLNDTDKYPTSQPYGDSDEATANVQYAALLLRTADLLHITSDRTPSMMFKLINPQDPVSQREWSKQAAVRRVKGQKGKDKEGNFSDAAQRTVIEVHATFDDADAFFGLTSYLDYVSSQLNQTMEWAETSAEKFALPYRFPWRTVDTSRVLADGFLPQQLAFSLDQAKILDLLTGHTLYNDTSVVIRELVQNAIDAVRLQAHIDGSDEAEGTVEVEWSSDSRTLRVRDSGTGMTRGVIEKNLLKAGASRYQEEPFRKQYPGFSPISRFGIGVLSTFMIADAVTVTTCSPEAKSAYQLTLRSVHGRYLLRLLDKQGEADAKCLSPNGTEVILTVRESADLPDVMETLWRWVVIPRCQVRAIIDGQEMPTIGFDSPADALRGGLEAAGVEIYDGEGEPQNQAVDVRQRSYGEVDLSYAVKWSRYFREWAFFRIEPGLSPLWEFVGGTCVEGIRVETPTPGFEESGVLAIVDARGIGAPKTNVARVGLDSTSERRQMLRAVYRGYLTHVAEEAEALQTERGLSMTWAGQEAELLVRQLIMSESRVARPRKESKATDPSALKDEMKQQPLFLIEEGGARTLAAAADLASEERLWTVDSALVRAAERILREIPADGSLSAISSGFETNAFSLPDGRTLVGYSPNSILYALVLEDREVGTFNLRRDERRVDLGWDLQGAEAKWLSAFEPDQDLSADPYRETTSLYVQKHGCPLPGQDEIAIRAHGSFYLVGDSALREWFLGDFSDARDARGGVLASGEAIAQIVNRFLSRTKRPDDVAGLVESVVDNSSARRKQLESEDLDLEGLIRALEETPLRTFDTSAWARREW